MTRSPCRQSTVRLCMLLVLLTGCASETPYPSSWQPRPSDEAWCGAISGAFENLPVESVETDEDALYRGRENGVYLTLAGIFFGERLVVVDVTHVTFEPTPEGALRVVPWFGERKLDEGRVIEPRRGDCDKDRSLVKSGWDFDGYMIASAALWTAGAVLPAATQV